MEQRKLVVSLISLILLILVVSFITTSINAPESEGSRDVTEHNYTFKGESEHWSAEFMVDGKEVFYEEDDVLKRDEEAQSEFIVTYKGPLSELSSVRRIRYGYEAPSAGANIENELDQPPDEKVFTISGNNLVTEDAVIDVTVQWNDQEETFKLQSATDKD